MMLWEFSNQLEITYFVK